LFKVKKIYVWILIISSSIIKYIYFINVEFIIDKIKCLIIILIINRIDKDIIVNSILFSSIVLIIRIIFKDVFLGDKFINKIFSLLLIEKLIIIIHKINVRFRVNVILWELENM
jgi:hypothetical protein